MKDQEKKLSILVACLDSKLASAYATYIAGKAYGDLPVVNILPTEEDKEPTLDEIHIYHDFHEAVYAEEVERYKALLKINTGNTIISAMLELHTEYEMVIQKPLGVPTEFLPMPDVYVILSKLPDLEPGVTAFTATDIVNNRGEREINTYYFKDGVVTDGIY